MLRLLSSTAVGLVLAPAGWCPVIKSRNGLVEVEPGRLAQWSQLVAGACREIPRLRDSRDEKKNIVWEVRCERAECLSRQDDSANWGNAELSEKKSFSASTLPAQQSAVAHRGFQGAE